jgi:hypothetical protein
VIVLEIVCHDSCMRWCLVSILSLCIAVLHAEWCVAGRIQCDTHGLLVVHVLTIQMVYIVAACTSSQITPLRKC